MKRLIIKRKAQKKTDYKNRIGLLKSGLPRIVIRRTNRYLIVQLIESIEAKDKILAGVSSKQLIAQGLDKKFENSLKSIPAAYLTGYLTGKKIIEIIKDKEVILDIGLQRNIAGSRLYAVLKGLKDAGVNINCDEKIFPSDERIEGKHLKEEVQKAFNNLKEKIIK